MQMNVTGHHIEVTDTLRSYVETKLTKLERHFDNITSAHVVLTTEKLRHKAEATIHVSGSQLVAEATNQDMYAAIDALSDKLDRQILKYKEKLTGRQRDRAPARKATSASSTPPDESAGSC